VLSIGQIESCTELYRQNNIDAVTHSVNLTAKIVAALSQIRSALYNIDRRSLVNADMVKSRWTTN
jgi:hypothetical protein